MKRKFLKVLIVLVSFFVLITNTNALEVTSFGETITEEGEYDSTRFIAGNRVTSKANIDGLSFAAGNEVNLEGTSEYGFYAGNILTISGNIKKDVFIAGNDITISKNATIGRDVYIAGNYVTISTNITRDLRVGANAVDLSGITINGDAYVSADEIILDKDTVIIGKLEYYADAKVTGLEVASIGEKTAVESKEFVMEETITQRLLHTLESAIAAIIVMLVLFYLKPSCKEKLDNLDLNAGKIWKTIFIGLAILIVVPIVSFVALLTGVLTPLALITFTIYGISLYLASLVVYYIIGKLMSTKLFHNDSVYLSLICGTILIKLIEYIPYLNGVVTVLIFFYGIGLIFNYIKLREK